MFNDKWPQHLRSDHSHVSQNPRRSTLQEMSHYLHRRHFPSKSIHFLHRSAPMRRPLQYFEKNTNMSDIKDIAERNFIYVHVIDKLTKVYFVRLYKLRAFKMYVKESGWLMDHPVRSFLNFQIYHFWSLTNVK